MATKAQLEECEARLAEASEKIDALAYEKKVLKSTVAKLKEQIAELEDEINGNELELAAARQMHEDYVGIRSAEARAKDSQVALLESLVRELVAELKLSGSSEEAERIVARARKAVGFAA